MDNLIALFEGEDRPGLYRLTTPVSMATLTSLAETHQTQLVYIDGRTIASKADFLQSIAQAMAFPDYFGHNWDALQDLLTDQDWLTGDRAIILYDQPENFAQHAPSDWQIALDILRSTVDYWRQADRPLSVLFQSRTELTGIDPL